jgi:hypothetical protein
MDAFENGDCDAKGSAVSFADTIVDRAMERIAQILRRRKGERPIFCLVPAKITLIAPLDQLSMRVAGNEAARSILADICNVPAQEIPTVLMLDVVLERVAPSCIQRVPLSSYGLELPEIV